MATYIFPALLVIFSTIHLIDSYKDDEKKRPRTKGLLLPMIIGYYLSANNFHIEGTTSWVLILALVTSWIGDVLLIPKGTKWFVAGGISFLVAHFSLIFVYVPQVNFASVNWLFVAPLAIAYYAVVIRILVLLKPEAQSWMFVPLLLYLLGNATMNVFAFMQLLSNPCAGSVIAYIGAAFFFVSDCSLYLNKYYKKPIVYKKHFTIMLTYILGEFLITQGMLMLL